jgi:hypothetical protein
MRDSGVLVFSSCVIAARIEGNINQDHRSAFLKGIMAGLAIKKADDELYGHCSEGTAWGISREDSLGCNHWINLYKWND